jgi:8-oxo-dGTP pyrophosphatase MutT (NUDIX family)
MVREHASGKLVINQPAGHLEPEESLLEAVTRETLEETAWHFSPNALLGIYQWQQPARQRSFLRFAFCGTLIGHEPNRELDTGIVEAVWLSRAQLANMRGQLRCPMVMQCVDDFLCGRRYSTDLLYSLEENPAVLGQLATMR